MSERTRAYDQYAPQLEELSTLPADDPRRDQLVAELTDAFRPVARNIARRFSRRGESVDDLEQVAAIGLLHALRRFDPDQGRDFLSYAVPTMMGEVRRHFRDWIKWAREDMALPILEKTHLDALLTSPG